MATEAQHDWARMPALQVALGEGARQLLVTWEINALAQRYGPWSPARWGALCARFWACTTPAALFTERDRIIAELDGGPGAGRGQ